MRASPAVPRTTAVLTLLLTAISAAVRSPEGSGRTLVPAGVHPPLPNVSISGGEVHPQRGRQCGPFGCGAR